MNSKLKKYAFGTNIIDPNQTLNANSINQNKAAIGGQNNLLAIVLDAIAGGTLSASQLGNFNQKKFNKKPSKDFSSKDIFDVEEGGSMDLNMIDIPELFAAYGGQMGANAEVEGNEVLETPGGEVYKTEGASHEQGGIDVNAPKGTKVFSDRIMIKDEKGNLETLAKKKEKLEKRKNIIRKALEKNIYDNLNKDSLARMEEVSQMADEEMMTIQDEVKTVMEQEEGVFKFGGEFMKKAIGKIGNTGVTAGDILGIGTNLAKGYANVRMAKRAMAQDRNFENPFENYGEETLKLLDDTKNTATKIASNQEQDLNISKRAAINNNRNMVRGSNTQAALNVATENSFRNAERSIDSNLMQTLIGIDTNKAQTLLGIDQTKMAGANQADMYNRQQIGSQNTAIAQSFQDLLTGVGEGAKSTNQIKSREDIINLLAQSGIYVKWDKKTNNFVPKEN